MKKSIISILMLCVLPAISCLSCGQSLFSFAKKMERDNAQFIEKKVNIGDHNIIYLEAGSGETILLVHGFAGDKDNWTRFAKYLTGKYRVISLDLPGFGESTRIETANYGIENQTQRLAEFVKKLKLERFHLAGNSMGGWISAYYSVKYPSRVISLTLMNSAGVTSPEKSEMFLNLEKGFNPLLVRDLKDYDRLLKFVFVNQPFIPGSVKEVFAESAVKNREFNDKIFRDLMANMLDLQPLLGNLKMPVIVIWGDSDRVLHISGARVFTDGIKGSKSYILKNCGHLPMIERPEETSSVFLEFIAGKN
jgi:pimeloyl-ACP methyl ester carboxylesterase